MWLVVKGSLARSTRVVHTALGVVLAVSLVCGTFVLTDTINAAYTQASAPVAGQVDVVVRSAAAFGATAQPITDREPMAASVLPTIQAVAGAGRAWGTVFGYVQVVGVDGRPVTVKGLPAMGTGWAPDATLVAGPAPPRATGSRSCCVTGPRTSSSPG